MLNFAVTAAAQLRTVIILHKDKKVIKINEMPHFTVFKLYLTVQKVFVDLILLTI